MKTIYTCPLLLCCLLFCGGTLRGQGCVNADFSDGNFTGWTGTYTAGQCSGGYVNGRCSCSPTNPYQTAGINQGPNNDPVDDAQTEYNQIITTSTGGYDANLASLGYNLPVAYPGNAYSARIGNMWQSLSESKTGDGESLSYSFRVTAENCNFTYHYAVVLYNGNHSPGQQAYFNISMMTGGGDSIDCAAYEVDATTAETIGGFMSNTDSVYWKPWSSVAVPLFNYIGQSVTITFTTRGCIPNGCAGKHYAYAYLAAECSPLSLGIAHNTTCGQNDTLGAPPGFATYAWTGPGIVGDTASQIVLVDQAGVYSVSMTTFGNTPCSFFMDTIIGGTHPIANFSVDSSACAGSPVSFKDLSTSDNPISSWQWNFGDNTTSNVENPTHIFTGTGIYPVSLTIISGTCASDTTILVTVVAPPSAPFTVQSPVCIYTNSNIVYTGNAGSTATFTWNFDGGTGNPITGPGPLNISWLTSGSKNVILTVASGSCTSLPDTEQVLVKPFLGMQLTPYTAICEGNSATLTANNCTTYEWAANPTLNDTNTATVIATPLTTTTYSVTGSNTNCVSVDTVTVAVYNYPTPTFTTTGPVCIGQNSTVTYTGNGGSVSVYNWNFYGGTASGTGAGPYQVNWLSPGTHDITLNVSLAVCDSSSTDTVSVFSSPPHPALTADTVSGCPGLEVCFTSSPVGNNIGYVWNFGDGLTSDSENTCHTYAAMGVYTVSFKVALSPECVFDTTLSNLVTIVAGPLAAFTPSTTLIQQPESLISFTNLSQNANNYLWNFTVADSSQSVGNSTSVDDTFNFTKYGQYNVTLYAYNQLGCPDSVSQLITVLPGQNYFIPNAFTPNGDGNNDDFYVQMQPGVNVLSFQVFDRWGEMVHDGPYPWDGTYKGKPAPDGVYVYLAYLHLVDYDTNVQCQGSVTLIR